MASATRGAPISATAKRVRARETPHRGDRAKFTQLRTGSDYPWWLLEPHRRGERAVVAWMPSAISVAYSRKPHLWCQGPQDTGPRRGDRCGYHARINIQPQEQAMSVEECVGAPTIRRAAWLRPYMDLQVTRREMTW